MSSAVYRQQFGRKQALSEKTFCNSKAKGRNHQLIFALQVFITVFLIAGSIQNMRGQQFINVAEDIGVSALPQSISFGSGLSFYDFNGDGLDDLSFTMTNDSMVFFQSTGNGFDLIPSYIHTGGEAKCLLWVDYDNDGDLDLFLSVNNGRYKLFENDGDFNFTDVSDIVGLSLENERHYGASFADYDGDGYLDFYVCTYAFSAGPSVYNTYNHLYKNNGDGTFTDVTEDAGVADGIRLSFQSVWLDYDRDGLIDLFVINDRLYANSLYKNNGDGTFTDVSEDAGIGFAGQDPMTATVGDFDNDGDLDIYMTNTGVSGKQPKLLVNNGDGTFTDMAASLNVTFPYWSWGAVWVDFDNNGLQDLYVATANPSPLVTTVSNQAFENTGSGPFVSGTAHFENDTASKSYGLARGDFNNDGYYDIAAIGSAPYDVMLWENQGGSHNYIKITLQGTASNIGAIGSWIEVHAGENTFTQFTHCGENYLSQNSQHHIFGLGTINQVDSVVVTYPSGYTDVYHDPEINMHHYFAEGDTYHVALEAGPASEVCEGTTVTLTAGEHNTYLWSNGSESSTIEVTESGVYAVTVFNAFGVAAVDTIVVEVSPLPQIFESADNPTCAESEDGTIQLQNETGVQPAEVTWSNGAFGEMIDSLTAGTYTYTYSDINGCMAEGTVQLTDPNPIEVEVFTTEENEGDDANLLVLASGGTPPFTIEVNGVPAPGGLMENLAGGVYTVLVTDSEGCTLEVEVLIAGLSTSEAPKDHHITLYPNPAEDFIVPDIGKPFGKGVIRIFSLDGKLVHEEPISGGVVGELKLTMADGFYVLTFESEGEMYFGKFTKSSRQ